MLPHRAPAMQTEPYSISGSEILSQPTPRSVRLSAYGFAAYGFIIALLSAMILGPPVAFLRSDSAERTLLERGVVAHFDITASEPTRAGDGQRIDYVFEAKDKSGRGGASMQRIGRHTVDDSDAAAFADPKNRNVVYDPFDPSNSTPVTSPPALARRHQLDRRFAIFAYLLELVAIFSIVAIWLRFLRRKLHLLRHGLATAPTLARCEQGRLRVEFRFTDANGTAREGHQSYNVRVGIGASFAAYLRDAIVFYDRDHPDTCELFLPDVSTFRFVRSDRRAAR